MLRECNSESFWFRSLPYASVLAATTHVLVTRGILKPNQRYGSAPKVVMGAIFGFFMGKFSYADACADKFLVQAPRTKIAEAVRARRGMPPLEPDQTEPEVPQYSGLGVPSSPPADQPPPVSEAPSSGGPVNYEELRRKNRGEAPPQPTPPPWNVPPPASSSAYPPAPPPPPPSLYRPPPAVTSKNKYGDEGFE